MLALLHETILGMWELEFKSVKEKVGTRTVYEKGGPDARCQCSEHDADSIGSNHVLKQHKPGLESGETPSTALHSFLQDRIDGIKRFR